MLAVASEKPSGNLVGWACGNITDLAAWCDESFDAALCLFSTFGMLTGSHARQKAIGEAHRLLRRGGVLLLHVHHLGRLLVTSSMRRDWIRDQFKRLFHSECAGDFPMPSAEGVPGWTMHLFTHREVSRLLRRAGFASIQITPIDTDGQRMRWPASLAAYGFLVSARKS
jgi:ubiquinone/menaquinone biosynthesis C-methylase UbiE